MTSQHPRRWAVQWNHGIQWHACLPNLFLTRKAARAWIEKEYGYIKTRPDLRSAPHHWRMPTAVLVEVVLRPVLTSRRKP